MAKQKRQSITAATYSMILAFCLLIISPNSPVEARTLLQPQLVTGTVEVDAMIQEALIDAIIEAQEEGIISAHVVYFAATNITTIGVSNFISLAGMVEYREDWILEQDVSWMGVAIAVSSSGGTRAAIEGTTQFSQLLSQIPETSMGTKIKEALDPLAGPSATSGATSAEIPRFPWETYYNMRYGGYGVHANGFNGIVSGWKAVDFFSDGNTGANHASNRLLASLSGAISYVCRDGTSVAIRIGNFFYSHLVDNANLNTGTEFAQGDFLGELRAGSFEDTCGYADQANGDFHVHWGFPNQGTLDIDGWVLDISTGMWTKDSQTADVFDWFYANRTFCTGPELAATQVILFSEINYCGTYKILDIGNYPDTISMGFADNDISSIKIGPEVKAIVYAGSNYTMNMEEFVIGDYDLRDNPIENNIISSIKVASSSSSDPSVLSILRADPNPTNADVVEFTVTFSEIVSQVDASDFSFNLAGAIHSASILQVLGSDAVYTIQVNTGSENGTLRLDVVDDDSIRDAEDNPLGGTGIYNGDHTNGEIYTIIKDGSPYDIILSNDTLAENEPAGATIGNLTSADFDSPDEHTYSFCGGESDASFSITGKVLSANVTLDYETQNIYTICIRTTDSKALSYDEAFTIKVSNLFDSQDFEDVPLDHWAGYFIQTLYNAGITGGCGNGSYCPASPVTRAQMAVFLLKGIHGPNYSPPTIGTDTGFTDVPSDYWAAAWIKQLAAEAITGGCGSGIYCPESTVTRAQMAVFLLKAIHGASYSPPPATGTFADVPADYWAAAWIEQLAAEGITGGCGAGIYCPDNPVTRDQMAVFLVKAFNLP